MSDLEFYTHPDPVASIAMLVEAGLPAKDLGIADWSHFLACGPRKAPMGLVGLEVFRELALLRSLVVADSMRGRGYGAALLEAAEAHAKRADVRTLYLLTETAEPFFAARGYQRVNRKDIPEDIAGTREFAELCPDTAAVMSKQLA